MYIVSECRAYLSNVIQVILFLNEHNLVTVCQKGHISDSLPMISCVIEQREDYIIYPFSMSLSIFHRNFATKRRVRTYS